MTHLHRQIRQASSDIHEDRARQNCALRRGVRPVTTRVERALPAGSTSRPARDTWMERSRSSSRPPRARLLKYNASGARAWVPETTAPSTPSRTASSASSARASWSWCALSTGVDTLVGRFDQLQWIISIIHCNWSNRAAQIHKRNAIDVENRRRAGRRWTSC